jgi:hypothetical protein
MDGIIAMYMNLNPRYARASHMSTVNECRIIRHEQKNNFEFQNKKNIII